MRCDLEHRGLESRTLDVGGSEYLDIVLEAGDKKAGAQTDIQDRQVGLGDWGVPSQVNAHGDHHQDQGITCPFLEGEKANPFLGNIYDPLDIAGGQFRKSEEINPGRQEQASQNQEQDQP